jgi:hypothetical protein
VIIRTLISLIIAAGLADPVAAAQATPPPKRPAAEAPVRSEQPPSKPKTKPRRVIIFGTTIVGDVLTPTIEKTISWQRPAAFRSDAAPLAHDFMTELLTPLDRDAILRDANGHGQ